MLRCHIPSVFLSGSHCLRFSRSPKVPWCQHGDLEIELSDTVRYYGKSQTAFLAPQCDLVYCKAWDSLWVLQARRLEWAAISSFRGPRFVRTLHYDLSGLGGPAWLTHSFTEVWKPLHHYKAVIHVEEVVKDRGVCRAAVHRVAKSWREHSVWTGATTHGPGTGSSPVTDRNSGSLESEHE